MRRIRALVVRLLAAVRPRGADEDFDREIDSHLQLQIDDHVRAGLSPGEARRAALLRFGGVAAVREARRDRRGLPFVSIAGKDLAHGVRMLRRSPAFTATAVVTLALGVGANAAMFGLVDALMFQPPAHVREPERVVGLSGVRNYMRYLDLAENARTLEVAAYARSTLGLGIGPDAAEIAVECVTASYFPLLGTRTHLGRLFGAADEGTEARTVVLGHRLWHTRFGRDPSVVGRRVQVAAQSYEVLGVAPPGFQGVELEPVDAWLLLPVSPEACSFTGTNLLWSESGSWLTAIGRLRAGAMPEGAAAELSSFTRVEGGEVRHDVSLQPLESARGSGVAADRRLARWLFGGALVVLLIACANVTGLLAIRAIDRRREIAVRLQVGGSRGRIFAQLLTENLVLAALAGGMAWLVAIGLDQALRGFFTYGGDAGFLSGRAAWLLAVFALGSTIVCGLLPAFQASRTNAAEAWRTGPAQVDDRLRLRRTLLVAQVALALTLVMAAGLFVRSLGQLRTGLGFDLDRVIAVSIDLRKAGFRSPADIRQTFDALALHASGRPDVESVALASSGLLGSGGFSTVTFLAASPEAMPIEGSLVSQHVTSDYFRTVGTSVIGGRPFTGDDARGGQPVIIVDESIARELWPDGGAVGRCAYSGGRCLTVVGVTEARRNGMRRASREFFRPMGPAEDDHAAPQALFIRTRGPAMAAATALANYLRGAAADLPYLRIQPLELLAGARTRAWRLGATMFGLFGVVAVTLTAVGIYGTLAFSTRRQTSEIGVRMTLGASPGDVLRMVGRRGLAVVALGWALGAGTTYVMTGVIESQLYEVARTDVRAFAAASAAVILAGLAGSVVPALRAARIDPAVALRNE
jgi:predicted permease